MVEMNINEDGAYTFDAVVLEKENICPECFNKEVDEVLNKKNKEDIKLVKEHCQEHLIRHHTHRSIKPIWCNTCKSLKEYLILLKIENRKE